jgi:hypothetical protein
MRLALRYVFDTIPKSPPIAEAADVWTLVRSIE